MDPDACLERMLSALDDNDPAEARDACSDLLSWLVGGGFAPSISKKALRRILQLAYERLIDLANETEQS
jgi:hypothetical protein